MTAEQTAELAHEINKTYCESGGDFTQPPWEYAPEWQRKSAILGVLFHWAHPTATAEDSHKSWLEEKRRDGWTYGLTKDQDQKKHPCVTEYENLPAEQQTKDHLFKTVVGTCAQWRTPAARWDSRGVTLYTHSEQGA